MEVRCARKQNFVVQKCSCYLNVHSKAKMLYKCCAYLGVRVLLHIIASAPATSQSRSAAVSWQRGCQGIRRSTGCDHGAARRIVDAGLVILHSRVDGIILASFAEYLFWHYAAIVLHGASWWPFLGTSFLYWITPVSTCIEISEGVRYIWVLLFYRNIPEKKTAKVHWAILMFTRKRRNWSTTASAFWSCN